jgi:hypothetical protein
VRLKHRETGSHPGRPISSVGHVNWPPTTSSSPVTIRDRALDTPPMNVDEALAEIECQREVIAELMHLGQPTATAELALNGMLREFASMIECEWSTLAEELHIKRSA